MSITLQNHLNAVAPAMGMIGISFEINYDEGEEENFNESWAEAFTVLRRYFHMIGYVLTKFEEGFEESVGKTIVMYAEDPQAQKSMIDTMYQMELDVVYKGEVGVKYARGIEPSFFGMARFTDLVVSKLKTLGL